MTTIKLDSPKLLQHDPDDERGCGVCPFYASDDIAREDFCRVTRKRLEVRRDDGRLAAPAECPLRNRAVVVQGLLEKEEEPIPMLLWCPSCGARHIDEGRFRSRVHRTHVCQACGMVWRPANVPTVGVHFLPGHEDEHR